MVPRCCFYVAATLFVASTLSARAADEIQVYNAEIAKVGQWTFQLHNNYAFIGRKEPDFPGGLVPNHALQGTGEWAYGITDWWEMGFYTPYAVDQELTPYSNAIKIRQLFVIPNAAEREFFYGVNFEFSYAMPQFLDTRWLIEMRPIVGWRKGDYEFIINRRHCRSASIPGSQRSRGGPAGLPSFRTHHLAKAHCAIYPHRGLVPPKAAVFVDMVAAHLQRVLAPARSESPRRSIGRRMAQRQPLAATKT
jgi:hypothetical protein